MIKSRFDAHGSWLFKHPIWTGKSDRLGIKIGSNVPRFIFIISRGLCDSKSRVFEGCEIKLS